MHLQYYFFGCSFAVVMDDFNVKLPSYTFYGGNAVCIPISFLLSLPLVFTTDSKVQVVNVTFDIG